MNITPLLCALACGCLNCWAQTNSPSPSSRWFLLSPKHLHPVIALSKKPLQDHTNFEAVTLRLAGVPAKPRDKSAQTSSVQNAFAFSDNMNAKSRAEALDIHRWLVRNGYMKPRPPKSDNHFVRVFNAYIRPVISHIHLGSTELPPL
jgi:hypothetical protein